MLASSLLAMELVHMDPTDKIIMLPAIYIVSATTRIVREWVWVCMNWRDAT